MEPEEMFEEFEDEFLKFDRISEKLSSRPDIHAFILLNKLVPGSRDMVAGASHDLIGLDVDAEELLKVATKEQLRDLHRCGVRYDSDCGGLGMFV